VIACAVLTHFEQSSGHLFCGDNDIMIAENGVRKGTELAVVVVVAVVAERSKSDPQGETVGFWE
jgi:hypothetical protein